MNAGNHHYLPKKNILRLSAILLLSFFLLFGTRAYAQSCTIQCQNCIQSANGLQNDGSTGFCPGRSVKLYFNGNCVTNLSQYNFQWQVSTGPGIWANIPGATTDTLTVNTANTYQLLITGPGNCSSNCSIVVNAYSSPVAAFSFAPNNTCGRTNVHFTNNSTLPGGGTMTYQWNFGDPGSGAANTSTNTNPSHYFIPPIGTGTVNYIVTLIATSSNGCKDTVTHTVTIGERPDATLDEGTTGGVATINGQLYFRKCSPTPWTMEFVNASTTNSFNTSYTIIWGDASPNYTSTTFPGIVSHTYNVGSYVLQYIVNSATCADTTRYNIFVGNQPAGGLLSPGSTTICNGSAQAFIISGANGNPPGTQYTLTFNDGSTPVNFIHPSPDTVFHTFDSTSCGTTSTSGNTTYPNAFGAFLTITNPCGTTSGSIVPIYVSGKPVANFSITPKDTVCQTQTVTFTNTGNSGNTAENGVCTPGKVVWKVTSNIPGTPWTLVGGNMGSDIGSWTTGTQNINIRFDSVGVYTIKLKMRNSTLCGMDSITKTICVNPLPTADFYLSKTSLCVDDSVTAFGITNIPHCGVNTYKWTVAYQAVDGCVPAGSDYTYLGGTSDTSANPKIRYNNPGIYAVSLQTIAPGQACSSPVITRYDTVKGKPVVTLNAPLTSCELATIAPTAITACFSTNAIYQWSFPGGSPASSTLPVPGNIIYNTAGTYTITLSVTNECGTTTRTSTITITPLPVADAGPDKSICSGSSTTIGSAPVSGNTYQWAPVTGLSSSTVANPTLSLPNPGATPIVFTYVVTVTNSNNCVKKDTVLVTVNPLPPVAVSPNIGICIGNSTTLTATGADSYSWTPGTGLSSTTGAIVTANPAVTTTYTVTGTATATGCIKPASVTVTVNPLPVVNAGPDVNVCNSQPSVTLVGTPAGGTWSGPNISGAGIFTPAGPGTFQVTYTYTNGNVCTNSDIAQVTVFEVATVANAGPDQDLCGTIVSMAANLPVTGTGAWSQVSGPNTATITALTNPTTTMTGLIPGTYIFRWTISNGPCTSSDDVTVLILPGPTSANAGTDQSLCLATSANLTANVPAIGTGMWTQVGGPVVTITTPNNNTSTVNGLTPGTYTFRWTISYSNCPPSSDDVTIIVFDNPSQAQAGIDQEICNSSTQLAATLPAIGTGQWTLVSGPNTPLITNPASATTLISNLVPGVYQFRWTVSNGVCPPTTDQVQITVGATPTTANAGPDQALCSSGTVTLSGNAPLVGTGSWTQTGGTPVTITNPALPVTTVTGMTPGIYSFQWTISNSVCPPSQDQVQITNYNAIGNQINTTAQTLCAGQTLQIAGQVPTGGNGIYSYQWQQSADGNTWTNIPGATGQNLSFTVSNSVFIRRIVNSVPCTSNSQPVFITVLAAIGNNTLNGNQAICINTTPAPIIGSVPNGGDGTFVYSWEQSTDGGLNWIPIVGANTKDYTPGVLTQNTCYRRLVSTNLCAGPQSNTSAAICITVNPDAQALFTYPHDTACAPFAVQIQNTSPANRHLRYDWYADNNFIGSGQAFPGYTIPGPGQSVTIKLVAISAFGCKNDSLSHVFATRPTADPSFTAGDTVGCGPLTVYFTNTTASLNAFAYFWDFGNGTTSTLAQPVPVVFNPNPNFRDTIYQVKLFAFNECDTQVFIVPVRVMSKPRAVFTPDRTTGCSPVTVTFNNLSQGIGMSYFWDFGDGATLATTSAGPVQHTYITGIQRTYPVRLRVTNNCGVDSFLVNIVVTPNTIQLDFAVDGTTVNGCLPHTVRVVNNSAGGSLYQWDFGDGFTYNSVNAVEVINHTYFLAGSFTITMRAINSCSDTTGTEIVNVYRKPIPAFTYTSSTSCIGDNVQFNNLTDTATLYTWNFGDGNFSNLRHPVHFYTNPGVYTVTLYSSLQHATGIVCTDSIKQLITITDRLPGLFQVSDTLGKCIPFTVTFSNQTTAAVNAVWNFGDGNTGIGNTVSHTYTTNGTYLATMTATAPGGCIYTYSKPIEIRGPSGTFLYNGGIVCGQTPVRFESTALNTDSVRYDFGDGQFFTGTPGVIFHSYTQPGIYVPRLQLISGTGGSCRISLPAGDTIKVDRVDAGFTQAAIRYCDSTIVSFSDTSRAYSGLSAYQWLFGDNSTGITANPRHNYSSSGNYQITQIVTSAWGCTDTARLLLPVTVNTTPVAQVNVAANGCLRDTVTFSSNISSPDPVVLTKWVLSNGITNLNPSFTTVFSQTGTYTVTFIAGTVNGCFDTTTTSITIHEIPVITASSDQRICLGQTVQLNASGATNYQWAPLNSLSCYNCPNPIASPTVTTAFVVSTISPFGCKNADTVVVQVVQPFDLTVSPNDSICIGQSTTLTVSGAQVYNWQPSLGLSCNNCQNPIANPTQTTLYRVVGYDIYNCFTDTGYVTVAVGQYPVVSLGPDQVLATGTQLQLNNTITNGPIRTWTWTPTADLSCNNCPLPVANIRNDVCYSLTARNIYGCAGSDTMCVKAFCNDTQVFIPNAFTPDDDGKNDILMVRASGIQLVKKFIIFNRWGEIVFERSNVPPNNPLHGWNGTVKGVKASSDVYVYIAEVICENGTSYSYKGNVTLLK